MNASEVLAAMPVDLVAARIPPRTESYYPVPHEGLLKAMYNQITGAGYEIKKASYSAAAQGNKMVGTLTLGKGNNDFGMTMGFRNSYDKSMSLGIGCGAVVFVCNNGMFLADVQQLRKHTTNVAKDFSEIMQNQLTYIDKTYNQFEADIDAMKSKEVTRSVTHELIGELFLEHQVLTTTQINIIKKEIKYSENFKLVGSKFPLWNVYNNVTESLKISHPTTFFSNHAKVHKRVMELV